MSHLKRHILILSTWFPPQKGVAVNRIAAFAKYLNKEKYRITVVSLLVNDALEHEVIDGVEIFRLRNRNVIKRAKSIPGESWFNHKLKTSWNISLRTIGFDETKNWQKDALVLLKKIHHNNPVDVLISSSAPAEVHTVAYDFCSKNTLVKWIADMRDELSLNPYLTHKQKVFCSKVEAKINEKATAFTTVSLPILNDFKQLIPNVSIYEEIRNGFDHDLEFTRNSNPVFTIAYGGTFYGEIKPTTFFKGLQEFLAKTGAEVIVEFIGTHKNFSIPATLEKCCIFLPQVNQLELIRLISEADANLLILPPSVRKGVYSGKLFDYISVLKPIIALVDKNDVAAELISEFNAGFIADFSSQEEIVEAIDGAYQIWKNKQTLPTSVDQIKSLHRKIQVQKLNDLIEKLLNEH